MGGTTSRVGRDWIPCWEPWAGGRKIVSFFPTGLVHWGVRVALNNFYKRWWHGSPCSSPSPFLLRTSWFRTKSGARTVLSSHSEAQSTSPLQAQLGSRTRIWTLVADKKQSESGYSRVWRPQKTHIWSTKEKTPCFPPRPVQWLCVGQFDVGKARSFACVGVF